MNASHDRRNVPRLEVSSEQFRLSSNGKIFSVVDLSLHGMGLRMIESDDLFLFPVGREFEGILNLHHEKYPLHAKVMRIDGDRVGCEFVDVGDRVTELIRRALDPAKIGASLKPMPQPDPIAGLQWYHGLSSAELLVWRERDARVSRFFAVVLGQYLDWGETDGLETGWVLGGGRADRANGLVFHESLELEASDAIDAHTVEVVREMVAHSTLPETVRQKIVHELDSTRRSIA